MRSLGKSPQSLFYAAALVVCLCATSRADESKDEDSRANAGVAVVATGEILGELEPCGCTPGQLGGLGRRQTYLKSMKSQGVRPIIVDNGDLVSRCGRQAEIKFEVLSTAMNMMGYAACNVGERDLLLGLAHLKQVQESAGLPLISANIVDEHGQPAFAPIRRVSGDKGNVKDIAIVGVLSCEFQREIDGNSDGLRIIDPAQALKGVLPELKKECKHVILLAHCPEKESVALARSFPEIALVISEHGRHDPSEPQRIGTTTVASTGRKGKYLIVCEIGRDPERCRAVRLGSDLSDASEMVELMTFYKEMVKSEGLLEKHPKKKGKGKLAGSAQCRDCHDTQYRFWRDTKHAEAYATLEAKGYQYDPECVVCHTTGFGFVSGFRTVKDARRRRDVGCECCHGPAKQHVKEAGKKIKSQWKPISKEVCTGCHTYERSPGFDYERDLEKIRPPH